MDDISSQKISPASRRVLAWLAVGAVVLLLVGGILRRVRQEEQHVQSVTWRVGFHDTEPFLFRTPDGKPAGFAHDVMEEAARRKGLKLEWKYIPQGAYMALESNAIDLYPRSSAVAGLARAPYISAPWFDSRYGVAAKGRLGDAPPADLRGRRVGTGPTHFAREFAIRSIPGASIVQARNWQEALLGVCRGEFSAAFVEMREANAALMDNRELCASESVRIWALPQALLSAGIGSSLRAQPAVDLLREEIGHMAFDGTLTSLHGRWFIATPDEVTGVLNAFLAEQREKSLLGLTVALVCLLGLATVGFLRMRRLRRTAEQASSAKSLFVAAISHELRTPMNGVIGIADILRETPLNADQRQLLDTITQSGKSLLTVINDVLDFSKLEAGSIRLNPVVFSPREAVESTLGLLAPESTRKAIPIRTIVDPAVPEFVVADSSRFRQVLLNLTANALKFSSAGSVRVAVAINESGPGTHLRVDVIDQGIGIPPAAVARLFTPFTQLDNSATRAHEGAGLGLAISKRLVSLMGGDIGCESGVGHGSTFWFEVPIRAAAGRVPERPTEIDASAGNGHRPLRVLVAEDNAVNQLVITRHLKNLGHSVETVRNGRQAVDIFPGASWDLILMDCQMPELDGYAATRAIRELERSSGAQATPIVALTAQAMLEDRDRCLAVGMNDYLHKPVEISELRRVLRRFA